MRAKPIAAFAVASALTAAAWLAGWPEGPATAPAPPPAVTRPEPLPKKPVADLVAELEAAATDEKKLAAASRLDGIPSVEIPAALGTIESARGGHLTFAAKALLIRWASDAPEAALAWAWGNLRSQPAWREALREIGPAWAWKDPRGFSAWALGRFSQQTGGEISLQQATDSAEPLLDFGDLTRIAGWLFNEDGRLGMELFLKRGGFSTHDHQLWDTVTDPRKLEQALLAFPPESFDKLAAQRKAGAYTLGPEMYAESLMRRWRDLAPEEFAQSSFAGFLVPSNYEAASAAAEAWFEGPRQGRAESARNLLEILAEDQRAATALHIAKHWIADDPEACRGWIESLPENESWLAADEFISTRAAGDLDETLDWIERFRPDKRVAFFVRAFDSWTKAWPEAAPDTSGWSDARRSAWEDLVALRNISTSGSP